MIGVFLDRDGTIGGNGGGVHPFKFKLYDFSGKAIKFLFNDRGIKVFLFTNQSWIGLGKFTEDEFKEGCKRLHGTLDKYNAFIDGVYYCPHKPEDHCECRKPSISLLIKAEEEFNLDLKKCYIIGDS